MVEYKIQDYHIELYFDDIPPENIRETLKICYWRWNGKKKCWLNKNTSENLEFAKNLIEELNPKPESPLLYYDRVEFTYDNILVRSNTFYCNKHHNIIDMAGKIDVCDKKGNITEWLIPISYCSVCDVYYVLEETFKRMTRRGIVLCQIVKYKDYEKIKNGFDYGSEWNELSPLKIMGYSVSKADGLSDLQRHKILENIIDSRILSKDRVLSYIDFFIRMHRKSDSYAKQKWEMDRAYIGEYRLSEKPVIKIGKIRVLDME